MVGAGWGFAGSSCICDVVCSSGAGSASAANGLCVGVMLRGGGRGGVPACDDGGDGGCAGGGVCGRWRFFGRPPELSAICSL